jgi:hypothetical protein
MEELEEGLSPFKSAPASQSGGNAGDRNPFLRKNGN